MIEAGGRTLDLHRRSTSYYRSQLFFLAVVVTHACVHWLRMRMVSQIISESCRASSTNVFSTLFPAGLSSSRHRQGSLFRVGDVGAL